MIEAIDEDNPYSLETAAAFHKYVTKIVLMEYFYLFDIEF